MANELRHRYSTTGVDTLYFVLSFIDTKTWNVVDGAKEAYDGSNWADYDLAASEDANGYVYTANMPSGFPVGRFIMQVYAQAGGSAAISDTLVFEEEKWWDGTNVSSHGEIPPGKVKSYP